MRNPTRRRRTARDTAEEVFEMLLPTTSATKSTRALASY